jgi:nickel/cobalt transporter (NiCoT) family protein
MPADWLSLCVLVFLLGIKHGFDADHLATIDGLTRLNHRAGKRFAPYCGSLFSLGHGAVVMLIAAAVGVLSTKWHTPAWLDTLGVSISVAFLFALGIANLRAVLAAEPGRVVAPVGLKGRFLGSLLRASHPVAVAGVGALFALSFDTVSQSALFALTAARFGGIGHALFLGALFVLGMLVTDGINGLWISRLIACRRRRRAGLAGDGRRGGGGEPAGGCAEPGQSDVADGGAVDQRQGSRLRLGGGGGAGRLLRRCTGHRAQSEFCRGRR